MEQIAATLTYTRPTTKKTRQDIELLKRELGYSLTILLTVRYAGSAPAVFWLALMLPPAV